MPSVIHGTRRNRVRYITRDARDRVRDNARYFKIRLIDSKFCVHLKCTYRYRPLLNIASIWDLTYEDKIVKLKIEQIFVNKILLQSDFILMNLIYGDLIYTDLIYEDFIYKDLNYKDLSFSNSLISKIEKKIFTFFNFFNLRKLSKEF